MLSKSKKKLSRSEEDFYWLMKHKGTIKSEVQLYKLIEERQEKEKNGRRKGCGK